MDKIEDSDVIIDGNKEKTIRDIDDVRRHYKEMKRKISFIDIMGRKYVQECEDK